MALTDYLLPGLGGSALDPTNPDSAGKQALGKASSQQPQQVDWEGLIEKQAEVNRIGEVNPYSESRFVTGPDGQVTRETEFSPEMQGLFDRQMGMAGDQIGPGGSPYGDNEAAVRAQLARSLDPNSFNEEVSSAYAQRAQNTLDPQFERQRRQMSQRLVDQGIPMNSEAYNEAMNRMESSQNQARENVALSSVDRGYSTALDERRTNLGELTTAANLGMSGQNQEFNQDLTGRQQQFTELASILGGRSGAQGSPIDVTGPRNMAMNADLARQQQMQQQKSSNANTAATAYGAYAMCDRRVKTDIKPVGVIKDMVIYSFRYLWDKATRYGVMSDESPREAVHILPGNREMVDIGMIYG